MDWVSGRETKTPADVKQQESEDSPSVLSDPGLLDLLPESDREVGAGDEEEAEV